MGLNYTEEKLYQAVCALASEGTLKFRLVCAANYLTRLKAEDFPDDGLRVRFLELDRKLTEKEPVGQEGGIQASVYAMSEQEAEKIAHEIVDIFTDIARRDPLELYHSAPAKEPEFH